MEEKTLSELFEIGQKWCLSIEDMPLKEKHEIVLRAIDVFQRCELLIESNSIFSKNEELEDIQTSSLQYLLVNYYMGKLFAQKPFDFSVQTERLTHLTTALAFFSRFLSACHNLKILTKEQFEQVSRTKKPTDPNTFRNEKIMAFKLNKEIKNKLEELRKRQKKALSPENAPVDEEIEREIAITMLREGVADSIEQTSIIETEKDMLSGIIQMRKEGTLDAAMNQHAQEKKKRDHQKRQPLNILPTPVAHQQNILQQVFRPGHNLPTISLEQSMEQEYLRISEAQKNEKMKKDYEARKNKPDEKYDENEINDSEDLKLLNEDKNIDDYDELKKERDWDEFKDDNPKGWGNTYNKG